MADRCDSAEKRLAKSIMVEKDGYCGGEGTKGLPAGAVSFTATEAWGEAHSEPADSGNREFSMEAGPD